MAVFAAASCQRYQICTVSSYDSPRKANDSSFVFENDSLKITYSFAGNHAPVAVTVFNKADYPLYIDWQRSALVTNDSAMSYVPDAARFGASYYGNSYNLNRDLSVNYANMNGSMELPKNTEFIPPHAFIKRTTLELAQEFFTNIPDSLFHTVYSYPVDEEDTKHRGKKAVFDSLNSPLVFTSYLAVYNNLPAVNPNAGLYKQRFYISELIKTTNNPAQTPFRRLNEGTSDQFYTKARTGYGKTVAVIGLVGVAAGAAALSATASNNHGQ
ncbi:hypothetical protein DXN05_06375 [Deminuibacter soli]|uniref:Uncharacterized protein n=2 Tax=Deminuibacter soli TaxID=2291815 RepID=A0A3E1NKI1_9BACT|nr:hypothetical protein DXN05_06375 [Deminuibacter soli]